MKILVINCGSSSLKFQLIDDESEQVAAKGLCERIGIEGSRLVYTPLTGAITKIYNHIADMVVIACDCSLFYFLQLLIFF